MATKEWLMEEYGTVNLEGRDYYLEDGDTWLDVETNEPFRGKGFDTEEVYHAGTKEDPTKAPETFQGYAQTNIVADMMQNKGYDAQEEDGKGYYGRTLGVVSNPDEEVEMARRLYLEGLVTPNSYTAPEDLDAYMRGENTRVMLGKDASSTGYYGEARSFLDEAKQFDRPLTRTSALNEREYAAAPYAFTKDVMFRHDDRTIDNKATSAFKSGFGSGLDSMQQGFWGAVDMAGQKTGSEYLQDLGKDNVEANQIEIEEAPTWIQDVDNVNSFSDFADWSAGALGGSTPYFLLMGASLTPLAPLTVPAMATTFAGNTWNDMEGKDSEKSASVAIMTGIFMATLERFGGKAVLGIKDSLIKQVAEDGTKDGIDKALKRLIQAHAKDSKDKAKALAPGAAKDQAMKDSLLLNKEARRAIATGINAEATLFLKDIGKNREIWNWYAKRVAKGTATGIGAEASTETLQELAQYMGSYAGSEDGAKEWVQADLNKQLKNAALAGGLLGGGVRGGQVALTAENPISTNVRMADWNRTRNEEFKEERLLDMHEVLASASKANVEEGRPAFDSETREWVYPTNRVENRDKVMTLVERFKATEKAKGTWARAKEVLGDTEFLSTRYNVLKHRLGERGLLSPTLLAEMEYSGWVDGRATTGHTLKQLQNELEGTQHQNLRDTADGVRMAMGLTDTHKNRGIAWKLMIDYKKAQIANTKLSEEMEANKAALDKGLRRVLGHEANQQSFLVKIAVRKPGAEHHTLTNAHLAKKVVEKGKDKFIDILRNAYGLTFEQALLEYEKVIDTPAGYDPQEYQATDFLSKKPSDLKVKRINYNSEVFKDFQEEGSYDGALLRATEVARYVSDMTALGHQGQGLNSRILQIEKELREANGDEWTDQHMPEIANSIINQHLAHRGEYHKIDDASIRAVNANLGAMMSLAYMPLALFASFPELGIAFLGADREMFLSAAKKAGKMGAQTVAAQMRKVANSERLDTPELDAAIKVMRERGMLTPDFGVAHVVDAEVSSERRNWLQGTVMPAFYKFTGLTSFTTMVRVIRDSFADDYINKHLSVVQSAIEEKSKRILRGQEYKTSNQTANAIERLQELGLDVMDVAQRMLDLENDWINSDSVVPFEDYVEMERKAAAKSIADALSLARSNFVDAALVNPDAGKRPLLYSDGRFRLLTIFQGYLSTFSATIVKPMLKKLAGKGTPAEQVNAAMVMMTMIGLGFLGQALKDEMKYGDRPSWLTDAEYMQRGIQASGMMGQTERIFNLFFPLYHSEEDTIADKAWAEVGPLAGTIDSIGKGLDWSSQGEWERALNKFLKVAPGGVLTQQRKAIANSIAGE